MDINPAVRVAQWLIGYQEEVIDTSAFLERWEEEQKVVYRAWIALKTSQTLKEHESLVRYGYKKIATCPKTNHSDFKSDLKL